MTVFMILLKACLPIFQKLLPAHHSFDSFSRLFQSSQKKHASAMQHTSTEGLVCAAPRAVELARHCCTIMTSSCLSTNCRFWNWPAKRVPRPCPCLVVLAELSQPFANRLVSASRCFRGNPFLRFCWIGRCWAFLERRRWLAVLLFLRRVKRRWRWIVLQLEQHTQAESLTCALTVIMDSLERN